MTYPIKFIVVCLIGLFATPALATEGTFSQRDIGHAKYHNSDTATSVVVSGPKAAKKGNPANFRIIITAHSGNPLAPINLIGSGMVALAVPESADVNYANIEMRILPYGKDRWEAFDWHAQESLVSKGIVALLSSILVHSFTRLALDDKTASVFKVSRDSLDVVIEHFKPVRHIYADLNHYDIVHVKWNWSVFRWKIASHRFTGQAKVEISIPIKFGVTLSKDQPIALLAAYRNHPKSGRGLTHIQENIYSWGDLLAEFRQSVSMEDLKKSAQRFYLAEVNKHLDANIEFHYPIPIPTIKDEDILSSDLDGDGLSEYFVPLYGHLPNAPLCCDMPVLFTIWKGSNLLKPIWNSKLKLERGDNISYLNPVIKARYKRRPIISLTSRYFSYQVGKVIESTEVQIYYNGEGFIMKKVSDNPGLR